LAVEVLEDRTLPSSTIWNVNGVATGSNNGLSWANAFTSLQSALADAQSGDQIWVAQGTYKPTTTTDRTISFALDNGVAVYGGFAGTETQLSQRDWVHNVTTLSGPIGTAGNGSYHVVTDTGTAGTTILDGFTITGGNAEASNTAFPQNSGGGMYNLGASTTLSNDVFSGNSDGQTAGCYGGAMLNYQNSNPTLTVSYAGFVPGDTAASLTTQPTVTTTATTTSPAGTYPITASGAVDANYTISYVPGTLTVSPAVTVSTANLPINAATITIAGSGFSSTAADDSVVFNDGAAGTITTASLTSLTATFTTPPTAAGSLTAVVTSNGVASGAPVQVATVTSVVTASTASLAATATQITIHGFGFDPTGVNNTVTFNDGAVGTVTAATATTLTVTFSTRPTKAGKLTAVVTTDNVSNPTAVQVAAVTA
jgi:hypothetical protein